MKDIKLMIEEYKSCLYFNEDRYLDALQGDPISICDIGTDFAREQNYENAVQCWLYLDRNNKADFYHKAALQGISEAIDALCRLGCYDEMHGLAFYHRRFKGVSE